MLFKDTADFCTVYPALPSADWVRLSPFVELIELSVIRDQLLGAELYALLHAEYQASIADTPVPMSPRMEELLPQVRKPLAFLAMYDATPTLNVMHTSSGMMVAENQQQKPAHMWRVRDARNALKAQGRAFVDLLIDWLLTQNFQYDEWNTSPVRREVRESFLPTVVISDRYAKLSGAWLLHSIRPALRTVQYGAVLNLMGQTLHDTVLANQNNNANTEEEIAMLDHIRPAMLHLALAQNVLSLSVTVDEDGVWNWQGVSSGSALSGGKQPAINEKINGLARHHDTLGRSHLEQLRQMVNPTQPSIGFHGHASGSGFFGG